MCCSCCCCCCWFSELDDGGGLMALYGRGMLAVGGGEMKTRESGGLRPSVL